MAKETTFRVNALVRNGEVRREEYDGTTHIVVPVVAAVEGVLNGEFVPIESIQNSLPAWEGVVVTMAHPKDKYGGDVSANSKDAVEKYVVGRFFNAGVDGKKFVGEFWINEERLLAHPDGQAFLDALESGEMVEVSTSYWRKAVNKGGVYKGKQYASVATDLVPNHIAILMHEAGACSVADGCGTPRVNSQGDEVVEDKPKDCPERSFRERVINGLSERFKNALEAIGDIRQGFFTNRVSHDDIRRMLREEIVQNERADYIYVVEVYDDEVVYALEFNSEMTLKSAKYEVGTESEGYPITMEPSVEVRQVVSYVPVTNSNSTEESTIMKDREQLIEQLATNEAVPFNREQLTAMDDTALSFLSKNAEVEGATQAAPATPAVEEGEEEAEGVAQAAPATTEGVTLNPDVVNALNQLGANGIQQVLSAATVANNAEKAERDRLVSRLVANKACQITEKQLRNMDIDTLRGVSRSFIPQDYSARGGPVANADEDAIPAPPKLLLAR